MKILANDGISQRGIDTLEKKGFEVIITKVAQNQLEKYINEHTIDALLVKSTTQIGQELIDACPSIKLIGCGDGSLDNIDVSYAEDQGLHVINAPETAANAVAELVFAHLFSGVRFLYDSNRSMPLEGEKKFKNLKKAYAKGTELRGKTLGVIGFGRIGQATAKMALGLGMKVIAFDPFMEKTTVSLSFFDGQTVDFEIKTVSKETVLKESDFITLHVPAQKEFVIGEAELDMMKEGAALINAARGGVVNEVALVAALDTNKLSFAGLDTFENEPTPAVQILMNSKISLTPHIGAATNQAQDRIGSELASQIISILK